MRPLVSSRGGVFCPECWEEMTPEEFQPVEALSGKLGRKWLYWRCRSGHLSESIPLP